MLLPKHHTQYRDQQNISVLRQYSRFHLWPRRVFQRKNKFQQWALTHEIYLTSYSESAFVWKKVIYNIWPIMVKKSTSQDSNHRLITQIRCVSTLLFSRAGHRLFLLLYALSYTTYFATEKIPQRTQSFYQIGWNRCPAILSSFCTKWTGKQQTAWPELTRKLD